MDTIVHVRVTLDLQKTKISHLIGRGEDIASGFESHPKLFPAPNPSVQVIRGCVQDLVTAQQAVRTRAPGAAEARNVQANTLVSTLMMAQGYVQGLINSAPPDQGPMIAKSAGMFVAQSTTYSKPLLSATQEMPAAPVHLEANISLLTAGVKGKISFNWQLSSDGGRTWITLPSTPHGRTDVAGLTALQTYSFRVSITSKLGPGPWIDDISFLVH